MSGIGIQKLNGAGTAAQAQLDALNGLIAKSLYSDLKKEAREFYGYNSPVIHQFSFDGAGSHDLLPNAYGRYQISLYAYNDTGALTVFRYDFYRAGIVVYTVLGELAANTRDTDFAEITGKFDSVNVTVIGSPATDCQIRASFYGFNYDPGYVDVVTVATGVVYSGTGAIRVIRTDMPDGTTYENTDLAGITTFEVFYVNGSNFLTPNTDFTYIPAGGFTLTGFGFADVDDVFIIIV